jgi:hypothetical protein
MKLNRKTPVFPGDVWGQIERYRMGLEKAPSNRRRRWWNRADTVYLGIVIAVASAATMLAILSILGNSGGLP